MLAVSCNRSPAGARFDCPGDPLRGVYSPHRLNVLGECRWFYGTVVESDRRSDGDMHLLIAPDDGYSQFLNVQNVNEGGLVIEIVPGQNLQTPEDNEHVAVFGTWVFDTHNGWNELHPVWGIRYLDRGSSAFALPPKEPLYQGDSND